jgi:hypothetical protein
MLFLEDRHGEGITSSALHICVLSNAFVMYYINKDKYLDRVLSNIDLDIAYGEGVLDIFLRL